MNLFNIPLGGMSEEEAQKAKKNIPEELWDRELYQQNIHKAQPTKQPPKVKHKEYKKRKPNPQADQNAKEYKKALRGEREWGVVKREEEDSVVVLVGMEVMRKQLISDIRNLEQSTSMQSGDLFIGRYGKFVEVELLRGAVIDYTKLIKSIWDKMVLLEAKKQVWDIYQSLIFPKRPTITPSLKKALSNLTHYFINSQEGELDLNKGILIWGGVGTSKTTLLKTFEEFTKVNDIPTKFQFSKMERLVEVATTEPKALPNHLKALTQQNRVFDDWGVEVNDKWGDGKTYFNNIILARYKKRANIKTHFTTNYSLSPKNLPNLEQIYSPRIISRLKEMVNLVGLGEGDLRG